MVLVNPLHPGNVGATARAMANFGLERLVLVDPLALDLERARWMATSGKEVLNKARIVGTLDEALEGVSFAIGTTARKRRWRWPILTPSDLGERIHSEDSTAILFGREDSGLDNEALARCHALLRIPTGPKASLNLAQAVLLIVSRLHDVARTRGWSPDDAHVDPDSEEGHRLQLPQRAQAKRVAPLGMQLATLNKTLDLLERTAYGRGMNREQVQVTLGQLLQRAQPSHAELEILLGMLAKTRYAVDKGPDER